MKPRAVTLLPVILLVLTGCASSLSGVGGAEHYACHAPEGAQCTSVSGVYANSIHGMPPRSAASETPRLHKAPVPASAAESYATDAERALRSTPRQLRVWIAPWEDSDGDLHEAATLHMLVDSGHWLIEHVRPARHPQPDAVAPPTPSAANTLSGGSPPSADRSIDRLSPAPATPTNGDAAAAER